MDVGSTYLARARCLLTWKSACACGCGCCLYLGGIGQFLGGNEWRRVYNKAYAYKCMHDSIVHIMRVVGLCVEERRYVAGAPLYCICARAAVACTKEVLGGQLRCGSILD